MSLCCERNTCPRDQLSATSSHRGLPARRRCRHPPSPPPAPPAPPAPPSPPPSPYPPPPRDQLSAHSSHRGLPGGPLQHAIRAPISFPTEPLSFSTENAAKVIIMRGAF